MSSLFHIITQCSPKFFFYLDHKMKPPYTLLRNPYNFQTPNPRVPRYKCQCIFLQLCTRRMCLLPALCFCCSLSEVIDTMMVFKRWAPGVMCVCGAGDQMGQVMGTEKPRATGGELCYVSQGSMKLITDIGLGLSER